MTKVFAHRGASGYAPENTLEAFVIAMEQGADGIELDVQLTKDGEVVVIHDETIDRVSDHSGFVKDYTLAELKQFDFKNHMEAYTNAKIPTLKEVLELVRPGKMEVNIELKTSVIWYSGIEEKVLEIVKETGMEERVIYSSFNHYSIQKILELNPSAQTAYLFMDVMLDVEKYAKETGVSALHPPFFQLKMADFMKKYMDSGLKMRIWTVNDEADMKYFMENNVEAIITNYPDRAVKIKKTM